MGKMLQFERIEGYTQEQVEDIFRRSTTRMNDEYAELLEYCRTMEPGDMVSIRFADQSMTEEETDKEIAALRNKIGTVARELEWPKLPGKRRRAYQTSPYTKGGVTYLWVRRLSSPNGIVEDNRPA